MKVVNAVNKWCELFNTTVLLATVDLVFAAARVVLGMSCQSESQSSKSSPCLEAPWRRRLSYKIQYLRRELSRLTVLYQG